MCTNASIRGSMILVWPSLLLFVGFFAVAAVDGLYFHFRRFRLWAHAETWTEHALHTARALLMPLTLAFLFLPGRAPLAAAAVFAGLDLVAGGLDVMVERRSRERFGGLPHGEYVAHLLATTLHVSAEALAFSARLFTDAPLADVAYPRAASALVIALVAGAFIGAVHHVVLLARGYGEVERPLSTS
jgi:hypothetical protein